MNESCYKSIDVRSRDSITLERQLSPIIPPLTLYKACDTTLPIRADPVYATVPAAADVRPGFLGSLKLEERDHDVLEGLWPDVGNKPLFYYAAIRCFRRPSLLRKL